MPDEFLPWLSGWAAGYDAEVRRVNAALASSDAGAGAAPFAVSTVNRLAPEYPLADEVTLQALAQFWSDEATRTGEAIADAIGATQQGRAAWDGDGAPVAFMENMDQTLLDLGDLESRQLGLAGGVTELARIAVEARDAFQTRVLVLLGDLASGLMAAPATRGASLFEAEAAADDAVRQVQQRSAEFRQQIAGVEWRHTPSRLSVLGDYLSAQRDRLRGDPVQGLLGALDLTMLLENGAALVTIFNGGQLVPNAYGVEVFEGQVPQDRLAITLGHTIIFSDAADLPKWMGHEMVHLRDVERHGAWGFYLAYGAEYAARRYYGDDHETAYKQLTWERSAEGEQVATPLVTRHSPFLPDPHTGREAIRRGVVAVVAEKGAREGVERAPVVAEQVTREALERATSNSEFAEVAGETVRTAGEKAIEVADRVIDAVETVVRAPDPIVVPPLEGRTHPSL